MWRMASFLVAFCVLTAYGIFFVIPSDTVAVSGQYSPYPYLSVTTKAPLLAGTTQTTSQSLVRSVHVNQDIDQRLVGLLLHVKWLMNQDGSTNTQKELIRLDKQILSVMDDIGEDSNDEGGGLPNGFEINNLGEVTTGSWLASVIADSYISDSLTLGASTTFTSGIITPNVLRKGGQVDEYCLTYEETGLTFEWATCGGGGGLAMADIDMSIELATILTDETGTGSVVFADSPTLVTPNLGTPTTLVGTNITGTATGLTAGTVTTNANLTGAITSTGNATALGSFTSLNLLTALSDETGSGAVVFANSPTFTGTISAAAGTLSSTLTLSGSSANIALGSNWLSGDGGDEGVFVSSAGNVGIGDFTPSYRLDVTGDFNLSAGSVQRINGVVFAQASTTLENYFSAGSGNLTMTGINNTANGSYALYNNISGSLNTANGVEALVSNTTGDSNTANGYKTLSSNTTGAGNTANGANVLRDNTTGNLNTANGFGASLLNTTGSNNTAVGTYALLYNTTGSNNTALDYGAGYVAATGADNNILLGYQAADNLTTGNNNIIIGYDIDNITATADNRLNIGNLIFGTGLDGTGTTLASGNVGIGTTTPAQKLQVFGNIRVGTSGSNGCIEDYGGGVIGGTCSSDENLKEHIEPLAREGRSYLEGLSALTPVSYNWNETAMELYRKDMNAENLGLIAQDVESQFPELVSENDDGYKQVDFRALPFYIIEALKELWAKVQGQDERLLELEQENEYLKNRIENIEDELDINAPAPPPAPDLTPEVPPEETPAPEELTEPAPEEVVEEPPEAPTYTLVPAAPPAQ